MKSKVYLVLEKCEKCQCKGNNEEHEDNEELGECPQNMGEHDHIDSKLWKLLDKQHQIHPSQKYRHSTKVPLPHLKNYTIE